MEQEIDNVKPEPAEHGKSALDLDDGISVLEIITDCVVGIIDGL